VLRPLAAVARAAYAPASLERATDRDSPIPIGDD
jgi:hypothetical protein